MNIIKGKVRGPKRIVFYGPQGCGKSTIACEAEYNSDPPDHVLALSWEHRGLDHIGPARVECPDAWEPSLKIVREAVAGPGTHRTIVIDTADALEQIAAKEICAKAKKESLSDFGYGDGYFAVATKWRELLGILEQAAAHGRAVHMVAHVVTSTTKDPTLPKDYAKYVAALTRHSWAATHQWADATLFCDYERGMVDGRAIMTGQRLLHTVAGTGFDAKHRPNIRSPLPLSWRAYEAACKALDRTAEQVMQSIVALRETTDADQDLLQRALVAAETDVEKLLRIESKLLAKKKETTA